MRRRFFSPVSSEAVLATLSVIGLWFAMPARAANIYLSYGTGITRYTTPNPGNNNSGVNLSNPLDFPLTGVPARASGSVNLFSLAIDSSGNIYAGDAGGNRVLKFSNNGTYRGVFDLPTDTAGGNISPQQIDIDTNGNLYTLGYGGVINRYSAVTSVTGTTSSASATTVQTIPGARGMLIKGTDMYVTTSSSTGAQIWKVSGITGEANTASKEAIYTTANYPQGQLRGMSLNGNTLYFADSSWTGTGGSIQSIDLTSLPGTAGGAATVVASSTLLGSPNSIIYNATAKSGSTVQPVMYIADYENDRVMAYNFTTATLNQNFIINRATNPVRIATGVTGLAVSTSLVAIGDEYFPELTFFDEAPPGVPEPGTWVLLGSALLMVFGSKSIRTKLQPARVRR